MMNSNTSARIRTSCPNPLFEKWLEEWREDAAKQNSDLQYCFGKALKSLQRYPLKLRNGKECLILKNFGLQLALKLDRKLAEYRKTHPEESIANNRGCSSSTSVVGPSNALPVNLKAKKRNKIAQSGVSTSTSRLSKDSKAYVPALRSGSHAILSTMLKEQNNTSYPGFMMKAEIMSKARDLCDSSFTRPDPGNHYTAWSNMSTLIKKGFVTKHGNPAKYTLTEEGETLARKLLLESNSQKVPSGPSNHLTQFSSPRKDVSSSFRSSHSCSCSPENLAKTRLTDLQENLFQEDYDICSIDDIPNLALAASEENSFLIERADNLNSCDFPNSYEQLIFLPGDFNIFLLVDTMETTGNRGKQLTQETVRELTRLKARFEVRHLKVGDFAWVARNKENEELVLPYIVERKRMDDLGKSIKDERFHEQKFRLRQCGLQNVIYLVEKFGNEARLGLPVNTLRQAVINSQVVDHFFIKTTNNHQQSMFYLSLLTKLLTNVFEEKTLISCARNDLPAFHINSELVSLPTFTEFSKFSAKNKNLKIQDIFMKQLLQLKGCSVEKASVIVHQYPTPRLLKQAFELSSKPETVLSNLTFGALNRNIGPTLSKAIYNLFTNRTLM